MNKNKKYISLKIYLNNNVFSCVQNKIKKEAFILRKYKRSLESSYAKKNM